MGGTRRTEGLRLNRENRPVQLKVRSLGYLNEDNCLVGPLESLQALRSRAKDGLGNPAPIGVQWIGLNKQVDGLLCLFVVVCLLKEA